MANGEPGLTPLGKAISFLLMIGMIGAGVYVYMAREDAKQKKVDAMARQLMAGQQMTAPTQPGGSGSTVPASGKAAVAANDAKKKEVAGAPQSAAPQNNASLPNAAAKTDEEAISPQTETPKLPPAMPYVPKNNVVDMDLSEWPGYAGILVANNGLEPSEDSYFFKKFGFKLKIHKSEEDNWAGLNSGQFGVAATTVDVLPVYGRQFKVVVPAQLDFSRGADGVVVRSSIKRVNDLKGKILACSQFTESDFFIRFLAQEANLPVHMQSDANEQPDANSINLLYCKDAFTAGDYFLKDLGQPAGKLAGCVTWAPKTTEVAEKSSGKAYVLTTNKNLLIVADVLIVNQGFAQQNPKMVAGLVEGIMEGNRLVRENPEKYVDLLGKVYKWDRAKALSELSRVHLSNVPENIAFFNGAIDMAGSFGGIFESAALSYGSLVKESADPKKFMDTSFLEALKATPVFKEQKIEIAPIRVSNAPSVEGDPLLTKDIRFFFEPNSAVLDIKNEANIKNLEGIKKLLQISPGSSILLRGHVDNAMVSEFRKKGGEAYLNQMSLKAVELSSKRAEEVKRLVVEKYQADPKRLDTIGCGWKEPASSTSTEVNRRVEVQWFTLEN